MKSNSIKMKMAFILATVITFFIISSTQLKCSMICIIAFMFSGALLLWGLIEIVNWLDKRYGGIKEKDEKAEDES